MKSTTTKQALVAVLAALALIATPLGTQAHAPETAPDTPSQWEDEARETDPASGQLLPQGMLDRLPFQTHQHDNEHPPLSSGLASPTAPAQPAIPCKSSQAAGCEVWSDRPGHGGSSPYHSGLHPWMAGNTVEVSPDGETIYALGWEEVPTHDDHSHHLPDRIWRVVSWDATTGEERWTAAFPEDLGNEEWTTMLSPYALDVSPDGEQVFIAGGPFDDEATWDAVVVAFDADTGTEEWVWRYDGPANGDGAGSYNLEVGPDGSTVFVTGTTTDKIGSEPVWNVLTAGVDAQTGEEQWMSVHEGPYWLSIGTELAVGPDGDQVYVSGYQLTEPGRYLDYLTLSYDAATGEKLWAAHYDSPATGAFAGWDVPAEVEVSPDGETVVVSGWSDGEDSDRDKLYFAWEFATVAYDAATGEQLWVARSGLSDQDGVRDIAYGTTMDIGPDGEFVYVAGGAGPEAWAPIGTMIVAYDAATGDEAWRTWEEQPGGNNVPWALKVSPDGNRLFVAQESQTDPCLGFSWAYVGNPCKLVIHGQASMTTAAFDAATGAKAWEADYGTPGHHDGAYSLAVSSDGSNVYTMGWSEQPATWELEMAIAAYNADGPGILPSSAGGSLG